MPLKYCFVTLSHSFAGRIGYLLMLLLLVGSPVGHSQNRVKPHTIRVVVDNNYAPYSFLSDEGELQGILIDEWRLWEEKTGIKAILHGTYWSDALLSMGKGEFDVIECIVQTPKRLEYFAFTPPYTTMETSIYFRSHISGITDMASLKGFPVGVKAGDQHIDKLKQAGITTIIEFDSHDAIIQAAKDERINVFLMDNPSALYHLNKLGIESNFRHSATLFRDELRRGVLAQNTALLKTVSDGFAAIESSELKKIDEKWFGQPIISYGRYLTYTGYVIAVVLVLILGLVVWSYTLRKAVLSRTAALGESEQRLRKNEERIRLIINTIPLMAWTNEPNGTVDFINERWLHYTGLSFEQYVKNPNGTVHPDDIERVMDQWRPRMTAEKPNEDEMRLLSADGKYRWFLIRTAPLHDKQGNLIKWFGVSIDIDESKQAKEQLQLAYQRLSYHVENTPLAVIELDKDLFITRWSKRAEQIFGWKASEALGKNVYDHDFRLIYTDDIFAVDTITRELTKGAVDWNLSLNRNYTKGGEVIYCEWYNSVLKDERGNVITILSLVDDVTERQRTEAQLRKVNEELHTLSSHLQNIQENERTAIAREIHDELGQLLTALKMEVGWLTKKLPEDASLKAKGNEILALVSQTLKTVKRIAMDLRPNILDELGLIAALKWQGQEFEKANEIEFQFHTNLNDFDPDKVLSTNIFRVHQEALTNIVRHAQATRIETSLETIRGMLQLVIKDNGKGFDVSSETNMNSIGLIGMKERSLMLHGELIITSQKKKGTVITLKVPLLRVEKKES